MRLIKNILVDLNNVAENYEDFEKRLPVILPNAFEKMANLLDIKSDQKYFDLARTRYSIMSGSNPFQHYPSFWQHLFEQLLNRNLSYQEIEEIYSIYLDEYQKNINIYDDFVPFQTKCKKEGFLTGIVANGNTHRVYRFLQKYNLLDSTNTIVTSGSNPFSKPSQAIFKLALLNTKSFPIETVFIGDRPDTDVAGANKSGIWSIRLMRGPAALLQENNSFESADYSVDSLEEVLDLPVFRMGEEITSVVIPCGGRGSRMGDVTTKKQKCMIELESKPILARVVSLLHDCGIKEFHFIVGYRSEDIISYFGNGDKMGIVTHYHQPNQPSTGQALLSIADNLPSKFLYCHANILFEPRLFSLLLKKFYKNNDLSIFVVTKTPKAQTHPVFMLNNGIPAEIKRYSDGKDLDNTYYSMGLGVIRKIDLNSNFECILSEDITTEQLLSKSISKVQTIEYSDNWFHLETVDDMENYLLSAKRLSIYE
jgi:HAD superfamily hydrolase (TIGR01549 family)